MPQIEFNISSTKKNNLMMAALYQQIHSSLKAVLVMISVKNVCLVIFFLHILFLRSTCLDCVYYLFRFYTGCEGMGGVFY